MVRILLAALCLVVAAGAFDSAAAQKDVKVRGTGELRTGDPSDVRGRVVHSMHTRGDEMHMELTTEQLVLSFSEEKLEDVSGEVRRDTREEGVMGRLIGPIVEATIRELTQVRMIAQVDEIESVRYVGGELVFTYHDGRDCEFDEMTVNDEPLTRAFAGDDARELVRRFEQVKRARG